MKPGWKTTEFALALGSNVAVFLNLVGAWDWAQNWHAGILATVANGVYAFSRGIAKHGQPPA